MRLMAIDLSGDGLGSSHARFGSSAIYVEKFFRVAAHYALALATCGGLPTRREGVRPSRANGMAILTPTSPSCTRLQNGHYGLWRVAGRASTPWDVGKAGRALPAPCPGVCMGFSGTAHRGRAGNIRSLFVLVRVNGMLVSPPTRASLARALE